jgi:hypothetical protein
VWVETGKEVRRPSKFSKGTYGPNSAWAGCPPPLHLLFIFYKYFLKIILQKYTTAMAVSALTTVTRHGVRSATDGGMEWPSNRRGPRRLHVAYRRGPQWLVF